MNVLVTLGTQALISLGSIEEFAISTHSFLSCLNILSGGVHE